MVSLFRFVISQKLQLSFTLWWKAAIVRIKDLPISFKNAYIPFPVPPQTQNWTFAQILRWIAICDGIYCRILSFCKIPCTHVIQRPQIVVSGSCDGPRLLASANTMRAQFVCCFPPPVLWKCVSSSMSLL